MTLIPERSIPITRQSSTSVCGQRYNNKLECFTTKKIQPSLMFVVVANVLNEFIWSHFTQYNDIQHNNK